MSEIWERRHRLEKERREKMQELMGEYDRTVFYPARKQLIEDCAKEGHTRGKFHDNGLGWCWWYNLSKSVFTDEEVLQLCKKVVEHNQNS